MNVRDAMRTGTARCTSGINLGTAVEILWNSNSGILPIVDDNQRVISVITERDICIALGTRNCLAGDITVGEVATHRAICCSPDDDVRTALAKMVQANVRRLPVTNADGKLEGIIAVDDMVAPILLKNSGRSNQTTSQDTLSRLLHNTDSSSTHQSSRLNT